MREQFGQKIGAFQAIKHLCAEMLETSESRHRGRLGRRPCRHDDDPEQHEFAALVAGTVCFDGAVSVAKACIQVLGGIGFTFEHDAHLYLRRALALRSLVGPTGSVRRKAGRPRRDRRPPAWSGSTSPTPRTSFRAEVRERAERIADLPDGRAAAHALAESGYLTPHWPEPHGLGADPVQQLVIDEELARAGVVAARPEDRRLGRADDHRTTAPTSSASASSARRCAARSSGASCSASPEPAPTSRRCARSERVPGARRPAPAGG